MEKFTKNHEGSAVGRSGLANALDVVDYYVGDLLGIAWKVALLFAVWISGSFYLMSTTSTPAGSQISAIGFWFGWLFLAATITLGALVTLLGLLDRVRMERSKRKY